MGELVRFDWAIKHLLRNKANFDILEGFLSELLKTSIHIECILESESNKDHAEDKYNRVDLLVQDADNRKIIIEVQCSGQWDYLSRILYGTSRVVFEHLRQGQAYGRIAKIISVSIVFFNLGEGKDYLYKGRTTFRGLHYDDILGLNAKEQAAYGEGRVDRIETPESVFPEYYLIKVTKFHERVKDKIDEWVYFLKNGQIKKEFAAQGIQSAAKKLAVLELSEEERRAYRQYEDSLHDDGSLTLMLNVSKAEGVKEALEKGEQIGLEKGEQIGLEKGEVKAQRTLAHKLHAKGFSLDDIVELTGLSSEEVRALFGDK